MQNFACPDVVLLLQALNRWGDHTVRNALKLFMGHIVYPAAAAGEHVRWAERPLLKNNTCTAASDAAMVQGYSR
jgi:hypothetical protein